MIVKTFYLLTSLMAKKNFTDAPNPVTTVFHSDDPFQSFPHKHSLRALEGWWRRRLQKH